MNAKEAQQLTKESEYYSLNGILKIIKWDASRGENSTTLYGKVHKKDVEFLRSLGYRVNTASWFTDTTISWR